MRLAQLARKIAVKPSEIVTFLATQSVSIEDSSNAKISDDYVQLVLKHFAPEILDEGTKGTDDGNTEQEQVEIKLIEEPVVEIPSVQVASDVDQGVDDTPPTEVIKPVKVELPGLKVVGKIDLPEPKKKTEEKNVLDEEGSLQETPLPRRPSNPENRRSVRKSDQNQRPRKNPIAMQRERDEREALRKRQEEQELQKELRTQRYLKKVINKTTPPKPIKRNNHEEEYEVYKEEVAKPKTLIGRILKWFVSE